MSPQPHGPASQNVLFRLKSETKEHHQRAEAAVNLPIRLRSVGAYAGLLARLYGFYAPLEDEIARARAATSSHIDCQTRRKAPALEDDLLALEWSPAAIERLPRCENLPRIDSPARLWGCLYVLEGATLGGRVIRRLVDERLGNAVDGGVSFFSGYAEQTAAMWKAFGEALQEYAQANPSAVDCVVDSAAETFSRFEAWLTEEVH